MTEDSRKPRELETREADSRTKQWVNPSKLLEPAPRKGKVFRWIRSTILGQSDSKNLSSRKREGWEPVPPSEVREFADFKNEATGQIEYGGLILCWMDEHLVAQRNEYFANKAKTQIDAVNGNIMRESDPRMPIDRPSIRTSETFGRGLPIAK